MNVDFWHPRCFLYLGDRALELFGKFIVSIERLGTPPIQLVVLVSLPKSNRGHCLIGLLTGLMQLGQCAPVSCSSMGGMPPSRVFLARHRQVCVRELFPANIACRGGSSERPWLWGSVLRPFQGFREDSTQRRHRCSPAPWVPHAHLAGLPGHLWRDSDNIHRQRCFGFHFHSYIDCCRLRICNFTSAACALTARLRCTPLWPVFDLYAF